MRDRDLVRLYWPVHLRAAFDALFAIDDAMADVVVRSTEPALGAVKLAWWRERLEALDRGEVPAEPRLKAAASILLPLGIPGATLARLEEGFATLLQPEPCRDNALGRGALLFRIAGLLLDPSPPHILEPAGQLYAAGQLHRLRVMADGASIVTAPFPIPKKFRPLTGLAALAARDLSNGGPPFEPEATPGRAWTLLRHRLTGHIAR